jgi:sucrose phosphorylase
VRSLQTPSPTTSFLNFLASHDGIGLRAAEGLLSPVEIESLGSAVTGSDGEISYRGVADGDPVPYELNSVYLDALAKPGQRLASSMVRDRFLAAHSIMFALAGVPLLYFHSLVGSRNWADGARQTGRARVINRQRLARHSLEAELADPTSRRRQVLDGLLALVAARTGDPAFHPSAAQSWVGGPPGFFAVQRSAPDDRSCVICVTDVTGRGGRFRARPPDRLPRNGRLVDLLDGSEHLAEPDGAVDVPVPPFGVRWLRCR